MTNDKTENLNSGTAVVAEKTNLMQKIRMLLGLKVSNDVSEQIADIIETREESNTPLTEEEKSLITASLNFYKLEADDVSIPRTDMVMLNIEDSFDKVMDTFKEHKHSRLPVFAKDSDDIVGFITLKDFIKFVGDEERFHLKKILRNCTFVPNSSPVSYVLHEMRKSKHQIIITVDEYGGTSGLVTLKDILERLVGDMEDENDKKSEKQISQISASKYHADPRMMIEDFEVMFSPKITEGMDEEDLDFDTLGGLVLSLAKHVPDNNETFKTLSGFEIKVLESDGRRVLKLEIITPDESAEKEASDKIAQSA